MTLLSVIGQKSDEWEGRGKEGHLWCRFRDLVSRDGKENEGLVGTPKGYTGTHHPPREENP